MHFIPVLVNDNCTYDLADYMTWIWWTLKNNINKQWDLINCYFLKEIIIQVYAKLHNKVFFLSIPFFFN